MHIYVHDFDSGEEMYSCFLGSTDISQFSADDEVPLPSLFVASLTLSHEVDECLADKLLLGYLDGGEHYLI